MWGIEYTDQETQERKFYTDKGEDMPVMFSSNASPRIKGYIDMLVSQHAKSKGLNKEQAASEIFAKAEIVTKDGLLTPSVSASGGQLVIGREALAERIAPGMYDPTQPWPSDEEAARPAFDAPGDEAPDEVEGQPPEQVDAEPQMPEVPEAEPEVVPADIPATMPPPGAAPGSVELNSAQQAALTNVTTMFDRAAAANGFVQGQPLDPGNAQNIEMAANMLKGMVGNDPAILSHFEDYINNVLGSVAQEQPQQAPQPQPQQASVIDKLVSLANKLDESGKGKEANQVDRLIRTSSQA
jgi:hypothetical protein